jgi:hypothetical protein
VQGVLEDEADAADAAAHATARSAKEHINAVNDYKRHTRSVHGSTEALEEEEEAIRDVSDALLAQADPFFAAVKAADDYQEALEAANDDSEITRDEALELGRELGSLRATFEKFKQTSGSYEAAMGLMQEATGMTRKDIEDLLGAGDEFNKAEWENTVSLEVNRKEFDRLVKVSSDISAAAKQGIKLDFGGLRFATQAEIEHAVTNAINGMIRTGKIKNIYL